MDLGCSLIARRSWVTFLLRVAASNEYCSSSASKWGNCCFIFLLYRAITALLLGWFEPHGVPAVWGQMASLYFPGVCVFRDPWCSLQGLSCEEGCYDSPFRKQAGEGDGATCPLHFLPGITLLERCWACRGTSL